MKKNYSHLKVKATSFATLLAKFIITCFQRLTFSANNKSNKHKRSITKIYSTQNVWIKLAIKGACMGTALALVFLNWNLYICNVSCNILNVICMLISTYLHICSCYSFNKKVQKKKKKIVTLIYWHSMHRNMLICIL